jgi:outer membrane receptor protein involved in Fe transport
MLWLAALAWAAAPLRAQSELEALSIRARRWPETPRHTLRSVSVVGLEDIARRQPRSPAEALREEPGVLIQQTMPGNAAVSVRGLIGKDNLVLLDGLRINTAATENVQSLSTVDMESLSSIEVLRGPGSVLYGGDALGGVVYLVPKVAGDFGKGLRGRVSGTVRSADDAALGRVEGAYNRGRFGAYGGVSARSFSHVDAGGALGTLRPSAYRARAADGSVEWRGDSGVARLVYQHVLQADVPRYDQYAQALRHGSAGSFTEFAYDPERRDLVLLEAKLDALPARGALDAKAYWQRQEAASRRQRVGQTSRELREDVVGTWGGRLQASCDPTRSWKLTAGAEAYRDRVSSHRADLDTATGALTDNAAGASYPDGSVYEALGLFALNEWPPSRSRRAACAAASTSSRTGW